MKNNEQDTVHANNKINEILEDMPENRTITNKQTLSETEYANIKINDQFYDQENAANNIAPTYIYNNTPAIKINEDSD